MTIASVPRKAKPRIPSPLDLTAGTDTVAAEDTFVGVADQSRGAGVQRTDLSGVLEPDSGDVHSVSQILEHTFAAFYTGGTVAAVGGEEKLNDKFSVFFDPAGVGIDHHAVSWHSEQEAKVLPLSSSTVHKRQAPKVDTSE